MARFALLALGVICATFAGVAAKAPVDYGIDMSERAYDAVCWYETLKLFPETHSDQYGQCSTTASQISSQVPNSYAPEKKASTYGRFMNQLAMDVIPSDYGKSCGKFLKDPNAKPDKDESDALNDPNSNIKYPMQGFAYCLMTTLRTRKGEQAIDAVKNERTHQLKHWRQTLLDRENEFRALHGVQKLKLDKALSDAAQEWAEDNAAKCDMYHSKNEDPRRQWRGKGTGESLSAAGGKDDAAAAAYIAADGWYEEIKDYPYPGGYKGNGRDALFGKIGHFTQSVWKETEYVGYGYAYNKDCPMYTGYVAGRYSPAGNMPGKFTEMVLPVQ